LQGEVGDNTCWGRESSAARRDVAGGIDVNTDGDANGLHEVDGEAVGERRRAKPGRGHHLAAGRRCGRASARVRGDRIGAYGTAGWRGVLEKSLGLRAVFFPRQLSASFARGRSGLFGAGELYGAAGCSAGCGFAPRRSGKDVESGRGKNRSDGQDFSNARIAPRTRSTAATGKTT